MLYGLVIFIDSVKRKQPDRLFVHAAAKKDRATSPGPSNFMVSHARFELATR